MKRGITIIEILITIFLLGIFICFCMPYMNEIINKYNDINLSQIKCYDQILFYEKLSAICSTTNEINYKIDNNLEISINNHLLVSNEDDYLILDNINYDVKLISTLIKEEYILLNVVINEKEQCLIIRGTTNEIYSN